MTSIPRLKLAHNAGEPDSVLALRIDVLSAAERLVDAWNTDDLYEYDDQEITLMVAVKRYRKAVKARSNVTCRT